MINKKIGFFAISFIGVALSLMARAETKALDVKFLPIPLILSGFIGADEILFDLIDQQELLDRVILSPLSKNQSYSSVFDKISPKQRISGVEMESIVSLKPDIVILGPFNRPESKLLLNKFGIPVLELNDVKAFKDIEANTLLIGAKMGRPDAAHRLIDTFEKEVRNLAHNCNLNGQTFMNFSTDFTVMGKDTSFAIIIEKLGGKNSGSLSNISGYQRLSFEHIMRLDPDYLVIGTEDLGLFNSQKNSWGLLRASKKKHLITVPSRYLNSVTHYLLEAMKAVCSGVSNAQK